MQYFQRTWAKQTLQIRAWAGNLHPEIIILHQPSLTTIWATTEKSFIRHLIELLLWWPWTMSIARYLSSLWSSQTYIVFLKPREPLVSPFGQITKTDTVIVWILQFTSFTICVQKKKKENNNNWEKWLRHCVGGVRVGWVVHWSKHSPCDLLISDFFIFMSFECWFTVYKIYCLYKAK